MRFKITKYVLSEHFSIDPDQQKAIRLNSVAYLEPIWPVHGSKCGQKFWTTEYFDSLQSVLAPLCKYMSTCYDMRVDFLSALFLTRRFHVVFSPFVTEKTQPAATLFLDQYGPLMKWITLEVDYSKLAGHWHRSALFMNQGRCLARVAELVDRFAERQATRYEGVNIQSFALLVRRYYGYRVGITRKRDAATEKGNHMQRESGLMSPAEIRPGLGADGKGKQVGGGPKRLIEDENLKDTKGKGKAKAIDTLIVETTLKQEVEGLVASQNPPFLGLGADGSCF